MMSQNSFTAPPYLFRAQRYLSTLYNLWMSPLRLRPVSELMIIATGLIAKLAPLAAFILTVQIAVWMISPERSPQALRAVLGYDANPFMFRLVVISAPVFVFIVGSGAQKLFDHLSIQVRRKTAYTLVEASLEDRLSKLKKTSPEIKRFFVEVRMDYQTVHRSVNSANNILNSTATVVVASAIGFMIAPFFVGILLGALFLLAVVFIIWRHGETNRLIEHKQVMLNEEIRLQKNAQRQLEKNSEDMTTEHNLSLMRSFLANGIGNPNELDDRFRSDTNLVSTFGPIVGVTALLAFLSSESDVTDERAAQLIMLVLVLRFCIGNLQGIITGMVGLTRDYSRLARICHGEEPKDQGRMDTKASDVAS